MTGFCFYLSFQLFYDESLYSPDRAYRLAKAAVDAISELDILSEENCKESVFTMNRLREKLALWMSDTESQMLEIQLYLDTISISDDDPGIILEFLDSRLRDFIVVARTLPTNATVLFNRLNVANMGPLDIIIEIKNLIGNVAGGFCLTRTILALMPNHLHQYGNVLYRLAEIIADPWFQSVIRQMGVGTKLGYISSLKTKNLRDMEPHILPVPFNGAINPFDPAVIWKR